MVLEMSSKGWRSTLSVLSMAVLVACVQARIGLDRASGTGTGTGGGGGGDGGRGRNVFLVK